MSISQINWGGSVPSTETLEVDVAADRTLPTSLSLLQGEANSFKKIVFPVEEEEMDLRGGTIAKSVLPGDPCGGRPFEKFQVSFAPTALTLLTASDDGFLKRRGLLESDPGCSCKSPGCRSFKKT